MTSALISTHELEAQLSAPALRLIDLRGAVLPPTEPPPHYISHRAQYEEAHLPGALFLSWHDELNQPPKTRMWPPAEFAALMNRLGISNDSDVVAYDDAGGLFAARLWWNLRYYGHDAARVLDGGWPKWRAEGRPITSEIPRVESGNFQARPQPELRRNAEQVMAALAGPTVLLDTRSPQEFAGQAARRGRSGHIPGACNLPRSQLVAADGTLKSRQELRDILAGLGIQPQDEVIAYCNSGVSASHGLFALHEAGYQNAANYDYSWNEWGSDPARPIASGE